MAAGPQGAQRAIPPDAAAQFSLLLQGSDFGFWDLDTAADEIHWYGDWYAAVDIDPCLGPAHTPRWAAQIHPDDGTPMERYRELIAGRIEFYEAEYRVRVRAGGWRWILTRARAISRAADGRALRVAGVSIDIDARKRAELKLRETEARLEAAIWGTQIGIWENTGEGAFRWLNDWCASMDVDPCEGPSSSAQWRSLIHPDDVGRCMHEWNPGAVAGRAGTYVVEYRIRTRSGRWRWIHERGRVAVRDGAGGATAFVGVCLDIDARKRMELALQSQARILETMREGVVLINAAGRIEYTNPAFDRMLGCHLGELSGRKALDLLDARLRDRTQRLAIERLLKRASRRGGSRTVLLRRSDATQFTAEIVAAAIDQDGESKIACVLQDVSERKRLEHEITEVAHFERRRLGSDLHDGLGQELTGISLLLRGVVPRIASSAPDAAPQLDEIIAHVNQAIRSTRKMAHGLSPVTLGRGGLVAALEALVQRARASLGVDARLRLGLRWPLSVDEASATHLYLIAQEALANAHEHGGARHVAITLRVNRLFFTLSIADDGVGIAPEATSADGMGLKIMQYRAGAIGGALKIQRRRQGGTRVRCVCPHAARSGN